MMRGFLVIALFLFAFGVCLAQTQPQPAGADTAKGFKLCPKCRVGNPSEARYCYSCGSTFEGGAIPAVLPESARADTSRASLCPVCGVKRYLEAKFCIHCGASFSDILSGIEFGPKKQPVLAFGLSLLVPGAGQFYNGQPGKGAIFLGGYLTGWGLFIPGAVQWFEHLDSGQLHSGQYQDDYKTVLMWAGIVVGGVSWVVSVIDAPASASELNRRRGYSVLNRPGIGLVFVPDPRDPGHARPGVGLRAGF